MFLLLIVYCVSLFIRLFAEDVVGTAFEVLMFDESAQGNVNEMLIDYSKNQQVATTAVQPPPSIFIPVTNLKDIPSVQLPGAPEMFPVSSGLQHRVKEEVSSLVTNTN